MITIRTDSAATVAKLKKVAQAFKDGSHMPTLARVAWGAHARLVLATPKGFTGYTRQSWKVETVQGKGYRVTNPNKVMKWLEHGTKAHGPKTKKALYIPLNRRAALGGWNDQLVRGVDYVLAFRVKGIKAMFIVRKERLHVKVILLNEMKSFVTSVMNS